MNLDRMLYLVISDIGMSGVGPLIMEVEISRMSRDEVAEDIRHGQYHDVLYVLELNPVENICRDVSHEFTRENTP